METPPRHQGLLSTLQTLEAELELAVELGDQKAQIVLEHELANTRAAIALLRALDSDH
jgi:hypothetical protein